MVNFWLKKVTACSACGEDHEQVETDAMEPEERDGRMFTRSFVCPTNGELVMVSYDEPLSPEDGGVHIPGLK